MVIMGVFQTSHEGSIPSTRTKSVCNIMVIMEHCQCSYKGSIPFIRTNMDYRGLNYEATHKEYILRLAKIDAVAKGQRLKEEYIVERQNILNHLANEGVVSLVENGFVFIGNFEANNKLLYLDTLDCS